MNRLNMRRSCLGFEIAHRYGCLLELAIYDSIIARDQQKAGPWPAFLVSWPELLKMEHSPFALCRTS